HVAQLFNVITFIKGPMAAVPYLLGVETVTAVAAGVGLARARAWAPWPAIVTTALLAVTAAVWFLFALVIGIYTFFGMIVPALAAAGLALAVVAKQACEETAAARKRLAQAGFQLGV